MDGKKWNIELSDIEQDQKACKMEAKWSKADSEMRRRTHRYPLYTRIAHNMSLYDKNREDLYSEGTTQAIKRKIRAQTIQRVPDGEIITQFDKNSVEQIETEFIFKNKILTSEYDGKDMMKNIWRTFNASYDYGFGAVRTGFEKDLDGDFRISYKLLHYNDVRPAPSADFIEDAPWYIIREYISQSDLRQIIDMETGIVGDKTYREDTVKFLIENDVKDGMQPQSVKLADRENAMIPTEKIEIRTMYKRGADSFVTWVPKINAILREVPNYDPRKDVPLHFMILEPDPEFPLGCSSVMWTMAQQQFADAFQSLSYQTLLLAAQPPLMGFGNLKGANIVMRPRAFWSMGTNPSNKVEPYKVETTTLTQYGSILENASANMMKNLNIADGTVASDANTMNYSGTPQGVEAQRQDKTITINQYQKRIEIFFSEWANHALRSYINAMGGQVDIVVDETTRRKIWDLEAVFNQPEEDDFGRIIKNAKPSIIDGDKIKIDFDELSTSMLEFKVRTGSLIESEQESERRNIQELLVPITQMLGNLPDEDRKPFTDNILHLMERLCELSNVDIAQQTANRIDEQLVMGAMQATMEAVNQQGQQIEQLAQMMMQQQPQNPQAMQDQPGMPMAPQPQMAPPPAAMAPPLDEGSAESQLPVEEPGLEEGGIPQII